MNNTEAPMGTFSKVAAFADHKHLNLHRHDADVSGLRDGHSGIEFVFDGLYARRAEFCRMVGRPNQGVCEDQGACSLDSGNADDSVDTAVRDRRQWAMVVPAVWSSPI